jgi:hypothetical protein
LWLDRVSAVVGSLLLNLDGPLTMLLAVLFFREHLRRMTPWQRRSFLAGSALQKFRPGGDRWTVGTRWVLPCLPSLGNDNNLTQRLSLRDPFAIVRIKDGMLQLRQPRRKKWKLPDAKHSWH